MPFPTSRALGFFFFPVLTSVGCSYETQEEPGNSGLEDPTEVGGDEANSTGGATALSPEGTGGSGTGGVTTGGTLGTGGSFSTGGTVGTGATGGTTASGGTVASGGTASGGSTGLTASEFYDQWKVQLQQQTGGSYTDLEEAQDESSQSGFSHNADYTEFTFFLDEDYVTGTDTKSRVELRERDGDGEDVAWSQAGTHTLNATLQIHDYTIFDEERDIIVLQAHTTEKEGSDPFDGGSSDSFGAAIYWRPESNKFECKVRPDSGDDAAEDLLTDVSDSDLEQWITFRIQVTNGEARCGYFDGSWHDTSYENLLGGRTYFKAGNYTQEANSTSRSGEQTEVRLKDVSVIH